MFPDFSDRIQLTRVMSLCVSGLVLNGAVPAHSQTAPLQPDPQDMRASFIAADTNHDNRLSWPEFRAAVVRIIEDRHDWRASSFKALSLPEQNAILHDRYLKMDSEKKGFLILSDWKP